MSLNVYDPARFLIETHWVTGWASRLPCKMPNAKFNRPANAAWCAFNILFGASIPISIGHTGQRDERHLAMVEVQVFVPEGTGTKGLKEHLDAVANIFRFKTISNSDVQVDFRTPTETVVGDFEGWYQTNISIETQITAKF